MTKTADNRGRRVAVYDWELEQLRQELEVIRNFAMRHEYFGITTSMAKAIELLDGIREDAQ